MVCSEKSCRKVFCTGILNLFLFLSVSTVNIELEIMTPEDKRHPLHGYAAHDEFFNSLNKTIDNKAQSAREAIFSYSKLDINEILQGINVSGYTFLLLLQSFSTSDLFFSKHLLEVNNYIVNQELPSELIRSKKSNFTTDPITSEWLWKNLSIPTDIMYSIVKSIIKLGDNMSEIVPQRFVNKILSIMNKSDVFMLASQRGDRVVMNWLLNVSINLNLTGALEESLHQNRHDIVHLLLENGALLNIDKNSRIINDLDSRKNSLLHLAAESNSLKSVENLLHAGVEVNTRNNDGLSPLYIAVKNDNADITKLLLKKGADANLETHLGNIALHSAAENGNRDIINLLIEGGSLIDKKNKYGITPLLVTEQYAIHGIIGYLLEKNITTSDDFTQELILFYDLSHLNFQDANLEQCNHENNSEKIIRKVIDHSEIAKTLLEKGGITYFGNNLKSNLLKIAIKNGLGCISEILINLGASTDDA